MTRLPWHAAIALVCAVVHDGNHLRRGAPLDVLWLCNVAVPLICLGCFLGRARPVAVGLTWLGFGTPLWIASLFGGANVIPTSPLVHVVAPLVAFDALRRFLGWPPGTWRWSMGASLLLLGLTRLGGNDTGNVNLVFGIQRGFEYAFRGSYAAFFAAILSTSLVWAYGFDRLMTRLYGTKPEERVKPILSHPR